MTPSVFPAPDELPDGWSYCARTWGKERRHAAQASWRRWFLVSELRKVKVVRTRACSVVVLLLTVRCGSVEAVEPQAEPRPEQQLALQESAATEQPASEQLQDAPRQQAAAERLGIPVVTTNSVGMRLVLIPAGEFLMGCHEPAQDLVAAFAPTRGRQHTSTTNIRGIAFGSRSRSISESAK